MTLVAPRIVNSVSCVTRINHEIRFSWPAQYLVMLNCLDGLGVSYWFSIDRRC